MTRTKGASYETTKRSRPLENACRTTGRPRGRKNQVQDRRKGENSVKALKRVWEAITSPFISLAVMIDTSKRINENGDWDSYWEKKNRKKAREKQ